MALVSLPCRCLTGACCQHSRRRHRGTDHRLGGSNHTRPILAHNRYQRFRPFRYGLEVMPCQSSSPLKLRQPSGISGDPPEEPSREVSQVAGEVDT